MPYPIRYLRAPLLTLLLAACASAPPRATVAPPATTTVTVQAPAGTERLQPPDAAQRASRSLQPTGLELGTMWTFENPPLEYWRTTYNFSPDAKWLEHVRLASARYGDGCSASFVSPDGLAMTNHHCARECIEAVSTDQNDYVEAGYYARSRNDEKLCPNLYLDQLIDIRDVTQQIRAASDDLVNSQQAAEAQSAAIQRLQRECQETGNACQVVPLYQGGQYQLYTYKRHAPVKLVFAPELQAGFFGGDPDNFTYPRYALDVAFVRAYERDGRRPAATPHYFSWNPQGAAEGELVFVTGNPGMTSRLITVSQLMYERTQRHPFIIDLLRGQRRMLELLAAENSQQEREVREQLFSVENSLKAFTGQLAGLTDSLLVGRKIAWERDFRDRVQQRAREYSDAWERMQDIQRRKLALNATLNLSNPGLVGAQYLVMGAQLSGVASAAALPENERPAAYRGDRFIQLQRTLTQPMPFDEARALATLELHITLVQRWLPANSPIRDVLTRTAETPQQSALRLVRTSRIGDQWWRQSVIANAKAADTISDPLYRAGRVMDSVYVVTIAEWRAVIAEETRQKERLGRALFAAYGTQVPPDATFTLRISDGIVSRYPYNGTIAPPKTTFYGLYARAAEFDNRMPWTLPAAFQRRRNAIDMSVPINVVSTNDISGGNSGSPLIDRQARIVGVVFDGNMESLPNQFLYDRTAARTISVHSAGILEALRSVYQANALVQELTRTR
jgi:hypothetical protein